MSMSGRQTLFRRTLFRQTLFRQSTVRTTQYVFIARFSICRNSRNWNKIGEGRGIACIESTSLIQAPRWPRGVGPGEWGGYSGEVRGAPPPEKLQCTSTSKAPAQLYCPPTPDFRDLIRRLSNRYCPQAYSTVVSHSSSTSRLWTVGIQSVGTESVGIAWCTPYVHSLSLTFKYCDHMLEYFDNFTD